MIEVEQSSRLLDKLWVANESCTITATKNDDERLLYLDLHILTKRTMGAC